MRAEPAWLRREAVLFGSDDTPRAVRAAVALALRDP
jgi:hypothetical protein